MNKEEFINEFEYKKGDLEKICKDLGLPVAKESDFSDGVSYYDTLDDGTEVYTRYYPAECFEPTSNCKVFIAMQFDGDTGEVLGYEEAID